MLEDEEEYWNIREITSKQLVENDEDEIGELNDQITYSKCQRKKIWKRRWINCNQDG